MEHLIIPENYMTPLSLYDTQIAIKTVKDFFQSVLRKAAQSAPRVFTAVCRSCIWY